MESAIWGKQTKKQWSRLGGDRKSVSFFYLLFLQQTPNLVLEWQIPEDSNYTTRKD